MWLCVAGINYVMGTCYLLLRKGRRWCDTHIRGIGLAPRLVTVIGQTCDQEHKEICARKWEVL